MTVCNQLKWSLNVHLYEEPSLSVTVAKIVAYFRILFQHYRNQRKVGKKVFIASLHDSLSKFCLCAGGSWLYKKERGNI